MAKVTIKNLSALKKAIGRNLKIELSKLFTSQDLRLRIGTIIVNDIKNNVDLGEAADSTKKYREYLAKFNITDPQYDQNRVKALFGGHLLDDLKNNIKGLPTELSFLVEHSSNSHPGYKTANGRTKRVPFSQISDWLINDKGYDYIKLTDDAKRLIVEEIKKDFEMLIL